MEIFYGMKRARGKRESDWKCVNDVRVHASAQSFDRCELSITGKLVSVSSSKTIKLSSRVLIQRSF